MMDSCNNLIIDAYNMIHRCRFRWGGGMESDENMILYNFIRVLNSTVSKFNPKKVYFVLDGKPKERLEKFSSYKKNRVIQEPTEEDIAYSKYFSQQKNSIIGFVKENLPVTVAYHPFMEGDDIVYNIVKYKAKGESCVIVSNDSDFLQVLNEFSERVSIWNPIKSVFAEKPNYDYVSWKAMVGDRSDNIPGVKGVGKVGAEKILNAEGMLKSKLSDASFSNQFSLSYDLIKFKDLEGNFKDVLFTCGEYNMEKISCFFEAAGFPSLSNEKYINKFNKTFSNIRRLM
tara:strand:- start:469 stop:1326 length:858 start_codon:yes stop_codon:yes gene_type:complete